MSYFPLTATPNLPDPKTPPTRNPSPQSFGPDDDNNNDNNSPSQRHLAKDHIFHPFNQSQRSGTPLPLERDHPTSGDPEKSTAQSARERLDRLINTITSVLDAYLLLPPSSRSPAFLDALREFQSRAYGLTPDSRTRISPIHRSPNFRKFFDLTPLTSPELEKRQGPSKEDVDRLEKEWWESDIVVAWYGPRPGIGNVAFKAPKAASEIAWKGKRRIPKEPSMRRDASYVGLNDE